jgi:hypothetical protein|tara:strand:- start:1097 stop:1405 length:309 start_codon:yes stop_codon:yes gene_type:complete
VKKNSLSHVHTPPHLDAINRQIVKCIENSDNDFSLLYKLVKKRDDIIVNHLSSIEDGEKKNFAKFEVEKNRELLLTVNNLLQEAKDEVSKLIRSKAAAKKYK